MNICSFTRWMGCCGTPVFAVIVVWSHARWGREPDQPVCQGCLNEYLDYIDECALPEPDRLIFVAA